MKNSCHAILLLWIAFGFFILHSSFCLRAQGSYSVDWFKITGGGGTSTCGVYSLTGTIGQPDAGAAMSGGNYSLNGGFWSLISILQTAGAPTVAIGQSGGSVIISWPSSATGWKLEQCRDLTAGDWTASALTVSDNGTTKSITVSSPTGNLFFRLHKP